MLKEPRGWQKEIPWVQENDDKNGFMLKIYYKLSWKRYYAAQHSKKNFKNLKKKKNYMISETMETRHMA